MWLCGCVCVWLCVCVHVCVCVCVCECVCVCVPPPLPAPGKSLWSSAKLVEERMTGLVAYIAALCAPAFSGVLEDPVLNTFLQLNDRLASEVAVTVRPPPCGCVGVCVCARVFCL